MSPPRAVLRYSYVFIESMECIRELTSRGFGARKLRPLVYDSVPAAGDDDAMAIDETDGSACHRPIADTSVFSGETPCDSGSGHAVDSEDVYRLCLLDEEAFYLAQFEGMVTYAPKRTDDSTVCTDEAEAVSLDELWRTFMSKNPLFHVKYKVYEFFKRQGYVVRTAVNYGLDFSLYCTLPSHCHSEACALVMDGTQNGRSETSNNIGAQTLGWKHLSTLTRVLPNISKLLLVCFVVPVDSTATPIDPSSMECLQNLSVRPVTSLVRRQQMSSERAIQLSVKEMQMKYRRSCMLTTPRREPTAVGVNKKRRRKKTDQSKELEDKKSRLAGHWSALVSAETSEDDTLEHSIESAAPQDKASEPVECNVTESNELAVDNGLRTEEHQSMFGWLSSIFASN